MNTRLSKVELSRKIKDAGYEDAFIEAKDIASKELITGKVYFKKLPSGIDVHCVNMTEHTEGYSNSQIDACISINVLLAGKVSFALEHQRYDIQAQSSPVLFINIINSQQIFTRFFTQQQQVKKVNLSITKQWLLTRCGSMADRLHIEKIFASAQSVFQWPCTEKQLTLAAELYQKSLDETLNFQWELEQLALQFFCDSFTLLSDNLDRDAIPPKEPDVNNSPLPVSQFDFEAKIESLLFESLSLKQIADKLGASVSTLQRYFKSHHQLTLKEYIRNQILEHARRRLIFDNQSVGEVAYHSGYNHVSNFSSAFKKYFSMTPIEMQNQYRNLE